MEMNGKRKAYKKAEGISSMMENMEYYTKYHSKTRITAA